MGALSGSITISGSITDANGLPLSGVTVHLDGTSQAVQVETGGTYSFGGLRAGSYSVRPTLAGCAFVPDVVNLNNLTASRVQNFGGSGTSCGGTASVNTGATTGALTISGLVRDASGKPIVGARVNLSGAAQAIRFSDFTGGYVFHVDKGTYTLTASGACTLTPASVNLNNLVANRTQNFDATNAGCITATGSSTVASGEIITVVQGGTPLFTLTARVMTYANAAQALASFQTIGREQGGAPVRSLTIAGLSAIERQTIAAFAPEVDAASGSQPYELRTILTTAIASGSTIVRFGTQVPTNTDAATINRFFNTARNFTPEEIPALHGTPPQVTPAAAPNPAAPFQLPLQLFTSSVNVGAGEIEMAATDTASGIVYATNGGVYSSSDGGNTITPSVVQGSGGADPTVGVGAPDGTGHQDFYFGRMGGGLTRVEVLRSADNGKGFGLTASVPIDCKAARPDGTLPCDLPDQPQMAVDRRAKSASSGGGDRVYIAWRNTKGNTTHIGISCSKDAGASWSSPDLTSVGGMDSAADFPRLVVGRDGFVYIMYQTLYAVCLGDGATSCGTTDSFCCSGKCQAGVCANRNPVNPQHTLRYTLFVDKYSSCDDGFQPQRSSSATSTFPVIVQDPVTPISDMPGIDRQVLGPYMIAGDDSDTSNRRLFLTFAEEASQDPSLVVDGVPALTNDNVRVAESRDAGLTWTVASKPVNTTPVGHRFFPWICTTNGIAYVSWYDRRSATLASTDLTSYFQSSVSDQTNTGTLAYGAEVNVSGGSGFDDPQCLSGFPLLTRSTVEETLCTDLPAVPALVPAGSCEPSNTLTNCDFRAGSTPCPSPQVCSPAGLGGVPKYGDYNGAACAAGNLFMAWTTAVPPKGQACAPSGATCATSSDCCMGAKCVGSVCTDIGACTANGGTCTAANPGFCCSGNCLGGRCQPFVGIYASSTAVKPVMSCATMATADVNFSDAFDIDTGLPPSTVGANYGQDLCPNQYLVEVDLMAAPFQGRNTLSVSGFWSSTVPGTGEPCELQATMSTYVWDGTTWQTWDVVSYVGMLSGGVCFPHALSHTNGGSVGLDVARIPLTSGYKKARIAVNAVLSGTTKKALAIAGLVN